MPTQAELERNRRNAVFARAARTATAEERYERYLVLRRGGFSIQECAWDLRVTRRHADRYEARRREELGIRGRIRQASAIGSRSLSPHPLVEALATARRELGISQQAVADECGMGYHTISDWEVGRRTPLLSGIYGFASALEMTVSVDGSELIEAVKAARELRGISQEALAVRAGVQQASLRRWETRQTVPVITTLDRVLRQLDLCPVVAKADPVEGRRAA